MTNLEDTTNSDMTPNDLKTLDQGTQKGQADIQFMLSELETNNSEHSSFMREIIKVQTTAV